MDLYSTREGVLLTDICGEYLLVADLNARKKCPYVRHINKTAAFLWNELEDTASEAELISALQSEYRISEEDARFAVEGYLKQLKENGYLVTEVSNE